MSTPFNVGDRVVINKNCIVPRWQDLTGTVIAVSLYNIGVKLDRPTIIWGDFAHDKLTLQQDRLTLLDSREPEWRI
jgi:small-conductance mechanosensitive channel